MTTKSGARIYRREPRPLAKGACPQCSRVIEVRPNGRRRAHKDKPLHGRPCLGSRVFVGELAHVELEELPDVEMPASRVIGRASRGADDPRRCECGQRPKLKGSGEFAAHRVDFDDPVSPYCPYGAARSY